MKTLAINRVKQPAEDSIAVNNGFVSYSLASRLIESKSCSLFGRLIAIRPVDCSFAPSLRPMEHRHERCLTH